VPHIKGKDTVNSPTFSIVNEYRTAAGDAVYHFDLYRLKKPEELLDIGYEDYFYSGNYCFIEWPEVAAALIPEECLYITIAVDDASEERRFMVS
jgi:tRNA threonylcarbamoyladenosine biosynthesis protein TsaE